MQARTKVLGLVIDAGEADLLHRWADNGTLPNIRSLRDRGLIGRTRHDQGFSNYAVWPSIHTGATPAQHGSYFQLQLVPGSYEIADHRVWQIGQEPFWAVLGRQGLKVAVLDLPLAPLAKDFNGIQLADWIMHDPQYPEACSWPPDLAPRVVGRFGADPVGTCYVPDRPPALLGPLRDQFLSRITWKGDLACDVLRQDDWDLLLVGFADSHCGGHEFWPLHDTAHPEHDAELGELLGDPLRDVYAAIDAAIGRILGLCDPQTIVVLFTGPGMGPNYTAGFLLNDVLRRRQQGPGSPSQPATPAHISVMGQTRGLWRRLPPGMRTPLKGLARSAGQAVRRGEHAGRDCFAVPHHECSGAIRINLVGREPDGRIAPGPDCDAFIDTLTRDLMDLVDPETSRPVVERVLRTADLGSGPCSGDLPDLLVLWRRDEPIRAVRSDKIGLVSGTNPVVLGGDHTDHGYLSISGPDLPAAAFTETVTELDMAPTIAALLGTALDGVNGRPLAAVTDRYQSGNL